MKNSETIKLNHTPGPWVAVEYAGYWELQDPNPQLMGEDAFLLDDSADDNARYNAQLAATSPELLEGNLMFLDYLEKTGKGESFIYKTIKGIIEKAIK